MGAGAPVCLGTTTVSCVFVCLCPLCILDLTTCRLLPPLLPQLMQNIRELEQQLREKTAAKDEAAAADAEANAALQEKK